MATARTGLGRPVRAKRGASAVPPLSRAIKTVRPSLVVHSPPPNSRCAAEGSSVSGGGRLSPAEMASATGDRPNSRNSLHSLHRSTVTIYVGPKQYPFHLHKGRLCQHSAFFEKAFHGSFNEASTGSMYMEEDGVDEFKLFEEWLYTDELSYPEDSNDPSDLLVKVFCFAEKVGISNLQNATLDAIRERATRPNVSPATPKPTWHNGFSPQPFVRLQAFSGSATSPIPKKPNPKYLPPATSAAIHHAYQNSPEASPLRKLLADIFAYNVKPDMLQESLLMLPAEFMADVLTISMRRLPLRFTDEKADFDISADKYYVQDTHYDRNPRVFEGSSDETTEKPAVDEDNDGTLNVSSSRAKKKKKGNKRGVLI
ncbi:MAG: hypothetical protein Q9176_006361 [Flavoplaca citrina]